jgi:hypothetical protein
MACKAVVGCGGGVCARLLRRWCVVCGVCARREPLGRASWLHHGDAMSYTQCSRKGTYRGLRYSESP